MQYIYIIKYKLIINKKALMLIIYENEKIPVLHYVQNITKCQFYLYVADVIHLSAPIPTMTHLKLYYLHFKDKNKSEHLRSLCKVKCLVNDRP